MPWMDEAAFEALETDIFEAGTQAVTITVMCDLSPYGGISKALFAKGGRPLLEMLGSVKKPLALGESVAVDAGGLGGAVPCGHLILTALWNDESEYTDNLVYRFYINSIRAALDLGLQSLALPLIKVDTGEIFTPLDKVVRDLSKLRNSHEFSLEEVVFCSTNEKRLQRAAERLPWL